MFRKKNRHTIDSDLWVPEFFDIIKVLEFGKQKHGAANWLDADGKKSSSKQMLDSAFHHLAEAFTGSKEDKESKLHPLLHLACRALMAYTRQVRGLVHQEDLPKDEIQKVELTVTLQQLKAANACESGYKTLLKHIGLRYPKTKPISILTILESNGIDDFFWTINHCDFNNHKVFRLIAADFAESVLHIFLKIKPNDDRPALAIKAARDFTNGLIDDAAGAAARAAARAAEDAAEAAAGAAARAAAWAAEAAAGAAEAAAWAAARAAEIKKQIEIIKKYLK